MRLNMPREFYIPEGAVKVADKKSTAIVYLYDGKNSGRPGAVGFHGKANKPDFNYTYRSTAHREQAVIAHFEANRRHEARRVESRDKRKSFVHTVKEGDIYHTSWGYDQTNVEFFQVIEVKGKFAILREIAQAVEGGGPGGESVVAQSNTFLSPRCEGDDRGVPIRRLIQDGFIKIDDVRTAWPWGKRGPGGVVIGSALHQTSFGFGH